MSTTSKKSSDRKKREKQLVAQDALVGRFISLTNLPLPIISHDNIDYYLKLLSTHYKNTETLWKLYLQDVETFRNQGTFEAHIRIVKERIRAYLNGYEQTVHEFVEQHLRESKTCVSPKPYPRGDIYFVKNANQHYASFDVKEANYQTLASVIRLSDPSFPASWKECVSKFSTSDFLQDCKYFRQIVFGKSKLSRYYAPLCSQRFVYPLIKRVQELKMFMCCDPVAVSNDEVIFQVPESFVADEKLIQVLFSGTEQKGQKWHFSLFQLQLLSAKLRYFAKVQKYPVATRELKCVQRCHVAQAIKKDV